MVVFRKNAFECQFSHYSSDRDTSNDAVVGELDDVVGVSEGSGTLVDLFLSNVENGKRNYSSSSSSSTALATTGVFHRLASGNTSMNQKG